MSDLTFSAAAVPDEADAPLPEDVSPGSEFHCLTCGKPLEYAGRGRKPKYCAEHRRGGARKQTKASTVKNERLASQATDALMQINGLAAFLAHLTGLPMTAEAINNAEPGLREQVHNALITDPDLCAAILKGGTQSARVSLILAYGMFGISVAPVAALEIKARKAERALAAEVEDGDDGRS